MRRRACILTVVVAAVLVAGCGGGSDSDAVKSTVVGYYHALASDDGATACSLLSASARAPFDHFRKGISCAELLTAEAQRQVTPAVKSRLQGVKVTNVAVTGQSASASVGAGRTRSSTVTLVKEGGNWKFQGIPSGTG